MKAMTDALAKEVFDQWPKSFSVAEKKWLRIRSRSDNTMPYLYIPGSRKQAAISDGLYAHFGLDTKERERNPNHIPEIEFVDVIAIEACSSFANFCDKRSRYVAENRLGLYCQEKWLKSKKTQIGNNDCAVQNIPVRFQSVMFVLKDDLLKDILVHLHPWANEFFLSWSKRKEAGENFQAIFRRMVPEAHFVDQECELVINA
ncbi:hypothetical protein [Nitrobacter sp.]|uniref:hypothetical protein n=1 Tax=Nitrobacter sp. TaxID=29420 RepID=UPI0029CABAE1|nr:hypothetical protein [Nitrobacter sp.]